MFRNIWLQNISFLLLALFSSVLLTTPNITGIVLAAMMFAAVGLSIVFERRAFCRYLCPVGGFIGIYSQAAPIELRIKDKQVCANCKDKPCYNGSAAGYGCPWEVFPGGLNKNTYCGLCMECIRTCSHDNIAVNMRPFSADLAKPSTRMDEAFKAFIMLGSSMSYAGVLLGPWGMLKDAAYHVGSGTWFMYAIVFRLLHSRYFESKLYRSTQATFRFAFDRAHSTRLHVLGCLQSFIRIDECILHHGGVVRSTGAWLESVRHC
jgi:polyferredoxin